MKALARFMSGGTTNKEKQQLNAQQLQQQQQQQIMQIQQLQQLQHQQQLQRQQQQQQQRKIEQAQQQDMEQSKAAYQAQDVSWNPILGRHGGEGSSRDIEKHNENKHRQVNENDDDDDEEEDDDADDEYYEDEYDDEYNDLEDDNADDMDDNQTGHDRKESLKDTIRNEKETELHDGIRNFNMADENGNNAGNNGNSNQAFLPSEPYLGSSLPQMSQMYKGKPQLEQKKSGGPASDLSMGLDLSHGHQFNQHSSPILTRALNHKMSSYDSPPDKREQEWKQRTRANSEQQNNTHIVSSREELQATVGHKSERSSSLSKNILPSELSQFSPDQLHQLIALHQLLQDQQASNTNNYNHDTEADPNSSTNRNIVTNIPNLNKYNSNPDQMQDQILGSNSPITKREMVWRRSSDEIIRNPYNNDNMVLSGEHTHQRSHSMGTSTVLNNNYVSQQQIPRWRQEQGNLNSEKYTLVPETPPPNDENRKNIMFVWKADPDTGM